VVRDCAIITWREGLRNQRGGIGKITTRERGGDVKFNRYGGGGITFFTLFHKLEKR